MGNSKKLYEDEDGYANICVAHGCDSSNVGIGGTGNNNEMVSN